MKRRPSTQKALPLSKGDDLFSRIRLILESARTNIARTVNFEMVQAYWLIGREIIEEEQVGKKRASYGTGLLLSLSEKLMSEYGKGFDESNLRNIRHFYLSFPNRDALRHELSWTHYRILMRIENAKARSFYEIECAENRWSTRELERQIGSLLYERLALSKDKKAVARLAKKGQELQKYEDMIKDPYVLEFVGLPTAAKLYESNLEQALIDNLSKFLLELGKGFTFVARQKRLTLEGEHFFIDLVFYNTLLRCYVLIDLKMGKLTHQDIGQMQMYVHYYDRELKQESNNPSVGLVLCGDKKEAIVRYTLPKGNKQIFASKYKLYLPSEKELREELKRERSLLERAQKLRKSD